MEALFPDQPLHKFLHRKTDLSYLLGQCIFQEYSQLLLNILVSSSARVDEVAVPRLGQPKEHLGLDQILVSIYSNIDPKGPSSKARS